MFSGRHLLIATKHHKEKVISPLFEKTLNVISIVPNEFDTDSFGTFSGEIERKNDPLETAILKCNEAMRLFNFDLALASEGSFGPHPIIPFQPCDDEWMVLIDQKNNLKIFERELSSDTNFNSDLIFNENELKKFATKSLFPSHALILKSNLEINNQIEKGITSWDELVDKFSLLNAKGKGVIVETDMRAMYNPTRMKVIEILAIKLLNRIKQKCIKCCTPGFGITKMQIGLPCELCGYPTQSILYVLLTCIKCDHSEKKYFPKGKTAEDPMYCDNCNP